MADAATRIDEKESLAARIMRYLRAQPQEQRWATAPQVAMAIGETQAAVEGAIDHMVAQVELAVRGRWSLTHIAAVG